jgi:hypothetical protein
MSHPRDTPQVSYLNSFRLRRNWSLCVESLVLLLISSVPLRVPLWLQGFGCGSAALGLIEIIRVDSRPAVLFSLPR